MTLFFSTETEILYWDNRLQEFLAAWQYRRQVIKCNTFDGSYTYRIENLYKDDVTRLVDFIMCKYFLTYLSITYP
jgi:hypothetical protein